MVAIALLDDYQNVALQMADWSKLKDMHRLTVFNHHLGGDDAVVKALMGFDVVCVMRERTPLPYGVIARLPNLRLIVTAGERNASIDVKAAAEHKIIVCGTRSPGHATAELAFGLILSLARHIPHETAAMKAGQWQSTVGMDLHGRTLGLIGLGRLGGKMARIGRAFGMKVIAWSANLTQQAAYEAGAERVDKADLFKRADVVSVHTRLSDRTKGLIGREELALMRPSALLVNTSRGPIVDNDALVEALRAGRIAGAALDVYNVEPLPTDHALRQVPRLILTPHLGYVTEETYREFYTGKIAAIEAWLAGKPIHVIPA